METALLSVVGVLCGVVLGYWMGRISTKVVVDEDGMEEQVAKELPQKQEAWERNRRGVEKKVLSCVVSPVSGQIIDYGNDRRPEVFLNPDGERLYAPASGKVIKLFPLGNEMLFRMEEGAVLRIKVGGNVDDLQSEYFRAKVVQNEVVNKGKLLLEFDRRKLEEEGVECLVAVTVEEYRPDEQIVPCIEGSVKVGEDIFEIVRK